MVIRGTGTVAPPTMSERDLEEISARMNEVDDQQTRTDLFRLFAEVERLRKAAAGGDGA